MFIQSSKKYKSLEPINPPIELPNLVILSGLNGAGKSQLLVAISQGQISIAENGEEIKEFKLLDHDSLAPNNAVGSSYNEIRHARHQLALKYENYKQLRTHKKNAFEIIFKDAREYIDVLHRIASSSRKPIDELIDKDIYSHYPLEDYINHPNIFYHHNLPKIYKHYQIKQYENEVNQFLNQKFEHHPFLSDEEFLAEYGEPPWVLVNKILREASLDYQTNYPEKLNPEADFTLKLINNLNETEIDFSELSSGEKIIISLALSVYNSQFEIDFPKILLMDEPDAHLHPSMTKQFLDVITNVFIGEKEMKIIMTTHSPSTVALAPEESIFVMNKTTPRIIKATKDSALRILTSGVPTLSINYENRRQVFVESKHDQFFYEKVYEKLIDKLVAEISINFISSGVRGAGNCEQVIEVVQTLARHGNRSIYGIIDWDTKNTGNDYVKVLGEGKRYSVENYIFDPIVLAAFLVREQYFKKFDKVESGLDKKDRYIDFSVFGEVKLQTIADSIVEKVRPKAGNPTDMELQVSEYICGKKIKLPSWFLRIQGHELESIIKGLFPELNRYQHEGELKKEIIHKVIDEIPDFIPRDILIVLSEIQNYNVPESFS